MPSDSETLAAECRDSDSFDVDLRQWQGDWPNTVLSATVACMHGVNRSHVIHARVPGALLLELYSRDGLGMMISADFYEGALSLTLMGLPFSSLPSSRNARAQGIGYPLRVSPYRRVSTLMQRAQSLCACVQRVEFTSEAHGMGFKVSVSDLSGNKGIIAVIKASL